MAEDDFETFRVFFAR